MSTGYACPVCEDPQADVGHLANHLAFTAMLRDDGHGDWLDERVPDWASSGEAALAEALGEYTDELEECEYPQVFEDTTGSDGEAPGRDDPAERSGALFDDEGETGHEQGHGHGHSHHDHGAGAGHADLPAGAESGDLPGGEIDTEEREAILEEAREMTRRLHEGDEDTTDDDTTADEEPAAEADDE